MWKEYISGTIGLMETRKWIWVGGWAVHGMICFDENGNRIFFVHFKVMGGMPYKNEQGDYGYLIFLPEYIEFTDEMKAQALFLYPLEILRSRLSKPAIREVTGGTTFLF